MAISPFRRRGAQIAVCVVMAFLFGILHVRNFRGAFISVLFCGTVFIWSRNIWYSVALHAGCNLTATLLAVYCWFGLGGNADGEKAGHHHAGLEGGRRKPGVSRCGSVVTSC